MDKVLVIKQNPQQTTAGAPVFVLGGGEPERGRGIAGGERLGGFAGKQAGRALAMLGRHRSFADFVQALMQGGAQGEAAGRRFGRMFVTPEAQARADRKAGIQQEYARRRVAGPGEEGFSDYGISAPRTRMFGGSTDEQAKLLQQRKGAERVAVQERKEENAEKIAAARARGIQTGTEDLNFLSEMERNAKKLGINRDKLSGKVAQMIPHLQRLDEEERQRQINRALSGPEFDFLNNNKVAVVGSNQDASGKPVQPIGPTNPVPMPPPDGSVGSKNESADPNAGVLDETGFNTVTENEPSDNMKPQQQGDDTSMNGEGGRKVRVVSENTVLVRTPKKETNEESDQVGVVQGQ